MATAVPALQRADQILRLLCSDPGRALTVSAVAAATGMSKATCFAQLACLAELGWVVREESSKTYRPGPELVHLGWASIEQVPGIDVARREMFALARQLDVACFACRLVGMEMVILDRAGGESREFDLPSLDALRVPARPPLGSVYFAWSPPPVIDDWLDRVGGSTDAAELEAHRRALAAIKGRGYSIGGGMEVALQVEQLIERIGRSSASERLELALTVADLVRGAPDGQQARYPVTHLIAPAFDAAGRVVLTLTIVGRPGQVRGGNVETFARPLLQSLDLVTAAISGRRPV